MGLTLMVDLIGQILSEDSNFQFWKNAYVCNMDIFVKNIYPILAFYVYICAFEQWWR